MEKKNETTHTHETTRIRSECASAGPSDLRSEVYLLTVRRTKRPTFIKTPYISSRYDLHWPSSRIRQPNPAITPLSTLRSIEENATRPTAAAHTSCTTWLGSTHFLQQLLNDHSTWDEFDDEVGPRTGPPLGGAPGFHPPCPLRFIFDKWMVHERTAGDAKGSQLP